MTGMKLLDLESNPKDVDVVCDGSGIAKYELKTLNMKHLVWFLMTCMGYLVMKQLYHNSQVHEVIFND